MTGELERKHGARPPDLHGLTDGGLLSALLEALPLGVSVEQANGEVVLCNSEYRRVQPSAEEIAAAAGRQAAYLRTTCRMIAAGGQTLRVNTVEDVTEQRALERELFERACFDELTGLANRTLLERKARELIDSGDPGQRFAVAFIDLDHFKSINDFYSHAVGDALLVKVAARLTSIMRPTDVLARIGGDEFILLISPVGNASAVHDDVLYISERLKDPFLIEGHELLTSASIGVSVFPDHGRDYEALRRHADNAMYWAKSSRRGSAVLFDGVMGQTATARMALEQRLRHAIRSKQFSCAYQPKVDLRSGNVSGVEMLLRWQDENGVFHPPGDFVNLAVELGLMNEIALLSLAETVQALDLIDDRFGSEASISVNIAARQAEDVTFMRAYLGALAETGCADRFIIELTEEAFFTKSRFVEHVLPIVKSLGVRVSIDDFGVGYSSLSALADIIADEIKIDRSFVTEIDRRPRSQSILKAVLSLAKALNMSVVAEGVETIEELDYLRAAGGVDLAQGFLFSHPLILPDLALRPLLSAARGAESARSSTVGRSGRARRATS